MDINRYDLENGPILLHAPTNTNSTTINVLVRGGSVDETEDNNGISHFIEHMLFDGSENFKDNREITNEIEKVGGAINAYTAKERTCYHAKVLDKHFDKALNVLSDVVQNPLFRKKDIEKEKNIICREIDLSVDEPRIYRWILLNKLIHKDTPLGLTTYGNKEVVKKLNRKDILNYYNKYYSPSNMIVTVVGNVPNLKEKVKSKFREGEKVNKKEVDRGTFDKPQKAVKKRKVSSSYLLLGFRAPTRSEDRSYVFDVIQAILGKGMSGRLFNEIRSKRGLGYDVGTAYLSDKDYGIFSVYANTKRKNIDKIKKIAKKELRKMDEVSKTELEEAKDYLEGNFYLNIEDPEDLADVLGFWEQVNKGEDLDKYVERIKKVSLEDVKKTAEEFFSRPYATVMIKGKN